MFINYAAVRYASARYLCVGRIFRKQAFLMRPIATADVILRPAPPHRAAPQ